MKLPGTEKECVMNNRMFVVMIILVTIFMVIVSGCLSQEESSNNTKVLNYDDAIESSREGVIYDVQITSEFIIVVFADGVYMTFHEPDNKLVDCYPYLDSFKNGYSELVMLIGENVQIDYVHFNYHNYYGRVSKP